MRGYIILDGRYSNSLSETPSLLTTLPSPHLLSANPVVPVISLMSSLLTLSPTLHVGVNWFSFRIYGEFYPHFFHHLLLRIFLEMVLVSCPLHSNLDFQCIVHTLHDFNIKFSPHILVSPLMTGHNLVPYPFFLLFLTSPKFKSIILMMTLNSVSTKKLNLWNHITTGYAENIFK